MTFTKDQLIARARFLIKRHEHSLANHPDQDGVAMDLELARMAMAGMEAEPVYQYWCYTTVENGEGEQEELWFWNDCEKDWYDRFAKVKRVLYTAPQPLTTSERAELENYRNDAVTDDSDLIQRLLGRAKYLRERSGDHEVKTPDLLELAAAKLQNYRNAQQVVTGENGLLPCPFCKSPVNWCGENEPDPEDNHICHHIKCTNAECGADFDFTNTGDDLLPDDSEILDAMTAEECVQPLRELCAKRFNHRAVMQSGAVKDGWVMVPVEPTAEMVAAAMLSDDVLFDQDDGTMFRVQHGAIWRAMLASAPYFREIGNSSTKHFRENSETSTKCWCHTCRPVTISDMRFVVCPECGNKRCPHANDHRNSCTGSNDPGQEGSAYPAAPQQEA